jgi:hypothetical protein
VPDKQLLEEKKRSLPHLRTQKIAMMRCFEQDFSQTMTPATRFGASPPHKNTFSNIQASEGTGMFLSNADRFDTSHNHRLEF